MAITISTKTAYRVSLHFCCFVSLRTTFPARFTSEAMSFNKSTRGTDEVTKAIVSDLVRRRPWTPTRPQRGNEGHKAICIRGGEPRIVGVRRDRPQYPQNSHKKHASSKPHQAALRSSKSAYRTGSLRTHPCRLLPRNAMSRKTSQIVRKDRRAFSAPYFLCETDLACMRC